MPKQGISPSSAGIWVRQQSVFTPAGGAALVIALIILIRSLMARNAYEILLSSAILIFLLAFGIAGAWKSRQLKELEPGWKPPPLMTANAMEETLVTGLGHLGYPVPLFFRLHFIVRGRFYPAGSISGNPVSAETSVPRGEDTARLELNFPMSGIFHGEGYCRLKDIFGLFSFSCGILMRKTLTIRSAPCLGANFYINTQSGAEDRRNKSSSDEERYYMREYAPGDRFRDINWKSSEKIDTLITRISPDNQEKINRINIYFRNYGPVSSKVSLEALWLLDRAKARLSRFLRSVINEQASCIFQVKFAQGSMEIKNDGDLEVFLDELSGIPFSPPVNESISHTWALGEIYVFSTACDIGLPAFLIACKQGSVSLFLTQPAMKGEKSPNTETISIRDFPANGCIPSPLWLYRDRIKRLNVSDSRPEINYAGTRL